jgi:hypothetical protein
LSISFGINASLHIHDFLNHRLKGRLLPDALNAIAPVILANDRRERFVRRCVIFSCRVVWSCDSSAVRRVRRRVWQSRRNAFDFNVRI